MHWAEVAKEGLSTTDLRADTEALCDSLVIMEAPYAPLVCSPSRAGR